MTELRFDVWEYILTEQIWKPVLKNNRYTFAKKFVEDNKGQDRILRIEETIENFSKAPCTHEVRGLRQSLSPTRITEKHYRNVAKQHSTTRRRSRQSIKTPESVEKDEKIVTIKSAILIHEL